ncbi:hypothetical protein D9M73_252020 [compost metagenome]
MLSLASRSRRWPASIRPLLPMLAAMAERSLLARRVPWLLRSPPLIRVRLLPWISAPLRARRLSAWAR